MRAVTISASTSGRPFTCCARSSPKWKHGSIRRNLRVCTGRRSFASTGSSRSPAARTGMAISSSPTVRSSSSAAPIMRRWRTDSICPTSDGAFPGCSDPHGSRRNSVGSGQSTSASLAPRSPLRFLEPHPDNVESTMPIARYLRAVTGLLPAAAMVGSLLLSSAASGAAEQVPSFLIRDVRLFDGHRVFEHRSVLVAGGVIRAIGGPDMPARGAQVIEGAGKTLLPGIIDAHVHVPHVDTRTALIQSARLGVTTDLDMFTGQNVLKTIKQIEQEDAPGMADMRSAGVGATVPGGHPTEMGPAGAFPTLVAPEEAEPFVAARVAEGSDYIKLILEDGAGWPGAKPMP